MRKTLLALVIALIALPAFAQQQPQQQQPQQTFFSETIEVRIINVDVIVTGKDGRPATGLTKDDFELFEDGKPQTISNFLEIRGPEAPAATAAGAPPPPPNAALDARPRNVVIFLDMTTMLPFTRDRIFEPMSRFLQKTMRAGDHVMIVSWTPGLKIELPFTNDVSEATKTLHRLTGTVTTGVMAKRDLTLAEDEIRNIPADYAMQSAGRGAPPPKPPISEAVRAAESYGEKVVFQQSQRVEALKSVMASLRGVTGHNALVVITDQLSRNPALPVFNYLEGMKDKFMGGETYTPVSASMRFEQPSMVKEISDIANSTGVTLYPISASGLGIDFDTVSAEHLGGEGSSGASTRAVSRSDEGLLTMTQIAAATGGMALTGSNNFDLAFNTLTQDMTSYYSLGYHTEGQRQDAVRSISVKLRRKGYNVRSREAFVEKSLHSEMQDAVAANLFYPVSKNDLNVTIVKGDAATTPPPSDQKIVVPVVVKIPTNGLTFIPDGTDVVGQFSSYTAFTHRDGKVSEVARRQHQLRFPADSLKRRKEITVKYDLIVDDRTDNVSVGIMDDTSHATGFAAMSGITGGVGGDAGHK